MIPVLSIVLPIFGLIGLGVVGGKSRLFPEAAVTGLTNFVLYVAVPALLFRTLVKSSPFEALNPDVAFAYYAGTFAVAGGALAFGRWVYGLSGGEAASFAMGGMFSNTGLIGIPLVFATWGEAGVVPLMVVITFHSLIFVTLFLVLHDMAKSGPSGSTGAGWANAGRAAWHAIATNPVVIAILVGLGWSAAGLGLPGPFAVIIDMLADAAIPAALFALGASLARFRVEGNVPQAMTMSVVKLVVHPVVVFAVAHFVFALSPLETAVVTLAAGLPGGLMVFVVAQTYGVYVARAGTSVVLSTAGGILTLSVLLAWLV
ncbi:MAG: AEC family transporter [Alphaproteobacteria bacterium]|nr:AEC family transporter [Alphaproteobacteria bacterium]